MMSTIFKQIWNQKRKNAFIALEMFLLFIMIFGSIYFLGDKLATYLTPSNFETKDRIMLRLASNTASEEQHREGRQKLTGSLSRIDGVREVGMADYGPFSRGQTSYSLKIDSIEMVVQFKAADPNFLSVLDLKLIEGEWFDQSAINLYASIYPFENNTDQSDQMLQAHAPIVVNQLLADRMGEPGNVVGRKISIGGRSCEIVGVIEPIKQQPFRKPESAVYLPLDWGMGTRSMEVFLHINPEVDQAFLMEQINQKTFSVLDKETWQIDALTLMDHHRARQLERERVDFIYIVFLGLFLMFTTLLGLTGIFSFNINKRKPEIGVLRAIGSSRKALLWRLIIEMVFISLLGILPAIFLLVQVPMLKIHALEVGFYFRTLAATFAFMIFMVMLFAWYPALKASQLEPALALKDE